MKQSLILEAVTHVVMKLSAFCGIHVHNSLLLDPILITINPVHMLPSYPNPLKPTGHYVYHVPQRAKPLHSGHRVYLCVPYGSHNIHRLFP
jgi:hypothetical protein